jgi:isocitrate/isopropylmalate dehydrogenase
MKCRKLFCVKLSDGLFVGEAEREAAQHHDVTLREVDIDAMAAQLVSDPSHVDVLLTTNMFGDILSNLAVALSGGLGLAAALNAGEDHAAANAGHGSAPDIAGKGVANPCGLILSAAMLLDWHGRRIGNEAFRAASTAIQGAVDHALADAGARTRDLAGNGGTEQFTRLVIASLGGA